MCVHERQGGEYVCACVRWGGGVVRGVVEWQYLTPVGSAWVVCHSLAPGQSGTCTPASLQLITLCRGEGVVVVVVRGLAGWGTVEDAGRQRKKKKHMDQLCVGGEGQKWGLYIV